MEIVPIWIIAYVLGSIPFGVLFARAQRIDLREHGSGNIGATNVARVLGKKAGVLTLLGDTLKGAAAVALAAWIVDEPMAIAGAGLMAFTGHLFSIFLKFKGGKGVATGLGIHLYMMPLATLGSIAAFALTLWISRYVSLSSILAALFLPVFGIALKMPVPYISVSGVIALLILYKHHENIQRIKAGTESYFLKK
ncbi:hypothetical protein UZ36_01705 [Candidatus Nitromaritima sp. SCGC AAA799-C22]|nr:hypothetical protein UZ36_01705 [Candidatus Nitromaritima sp. SCGC AAA799-C22]